MTGLDISNALVEYIAASVPTLNAVPAVASSDYRFSAIPTPPSDGVTDRYRFLKTYVPIACKTGVTVSCVAGADRVMERYAPSGALREVIVSVVLTIAAPALRDPNRVIPAKAAMIDALYDLLKSLRTFATPAGETYDCQVLDRVYGYDNKALQGDFTTSVAGLEWRCLYSTGE
ncbi:MAG TPA: hypothetical protein VGM51_09575 [Armatimonadota bacterium]|jgi:hypothetical protein